MASIGAVLEKLAGGIGLKTFPSEVTETEIKRCPKSLEALFGLQTWPANKWDSDGPLPQIWNIKFKKEKHGKSWKIGKSLNISGISEQTQR